MQQFLFENPLWISVCGLFVAVVAGFLWIQTGARVAWLTAVAAIVLTVVLVVVSVRVETDREKIHRTINEVAEAVEANDLKRVIGFIYANATEGMARAKQELPKYTFREARMTRLKSILVNRRSTPATAVAEFHVMVDLAANGQDARLPRFVKAYFVEDHDRWLVNDYEHFDVGVGFRSE
ncbi:MAG: hypothetical protein IT422_00350 [Pirellulaceae bacterium]|nr:hypothetical protein [Pirellulaceae bacterium]